MTNYWFKITNTKTKSAFWRQHDPLALMWFIATATNLIPPILYFVWLQEEGVVGMEDNRMESRVGKLIYVKARPLHHWRP